MRATLMFLILIGLHAGMAWAQAPLEFGSPQAAFAGGPIRLSRSEIALLRSHYEGDKVPLVPQPFRGKLDAALLARDWPLVDTVKSQLVAARGIVMALAWEQSRFIATGSPDVAEMHALDVAATGSTGLSETAVMLWFYAAAVTLTDGHQCIDETATEAHLDRLRGPAFEPVTRIVRSISDERLAAMRELAIRLELVLAPERTGDTMCRNASGGAEVKTDLGWRAEAAATRTMLPKHLTALAAVMRPLPIARPEQPRPEIARPVVASPVERPAEPPKPAIDPLATPRPVLEPENAETSTNATASEAAPSEPATRDAANSNVLDAGPGKSNPAPGEAAGPDTSTKQ